MIVGRDEIQLLYTARDLTGRAVRSVAQNVRGALQSTERLAGSLASLSSRAVLGGLSRVASTLGSLAGFGTLIGAGGVAGGIALLTREGTESASAFTRYGLAVNGTAEQLQRLALISNSSFEDTFEGLKNLRERIGEAAQEPTGGIAEAFGALGIARDEIQSLATADIETVFFRFSDAVSQADDSSVRLFRSMELLGEEGNRLISSLSQGSDQLRASIADLDPLGAIVPQESIDRINAFSGALRITQRVGTALSGFVASEFAPILTRLNSTLLAFIEVNGGVGPVVSQAFAIATRAFESSRAVLRSVGTVGTNVAATLVDGFRLVGSFVNNTVDLFRVGLDAALAGLEALTRGQLAIQNAVNAVNPFGDDREQLALRQQRLQTLADIARQRQELSEAANASFEARDQVSAAIAELRGSFSDEDGNPLFQAPTTEQITRIENTLAGIRSRAVEAANRQSEVQATVGAVAPSAAAGTAANDDDAVNSVVVDFRRRANALRREFSTEREQLIREYRDDLDTIASIPLSILPEVERDMLVSRVEDAYQEARRELENREFDPPIRVKADVEVEVPDVARLLTERQEQNIGGVGDLVGAFAAIQQSGLDSRRAALQSRAQEIQTLRSELSELSESGDARDVAAAESRIASLEQIQNRETELARRKFEQTRQAQRALAIVNTIGAAVSAFNSTPGGLFAKIAALTGALAAGYAQVRQINSTRFDSGVGTAGATGAGAASSTFTPTAQQTAASLTSQQVQPLDSPRSVQRQRPADINLFFEPGLYRAEDFVDAARAMNEGIEDGLYNINARQAA